MPEVGQTRPTPPATSVGSRFSKEVQEIESRINRACDQVATVATGLLGSQANSSKPAATSPIPPSTPTLDACLGNLRGAVSYLEEQVNRLFE